MLNQHITNYLHHTNKYEFGIQTRAENGTNHVFKILKIN